MVAAPAKADPGPGSPDSRTEGTAGRGAAGARPAPQPSAWPGRALSFTPLAGFLPGADPGHSSARPAPGPGSPGQGRTLGEEGLRAHQALPETLPTAFHPPLPDNAPSRASLVSQGSAFRPCQEPSTTLGRQSLWDRGRRGPTSTHPRRTHLAGHKGRKCLPEALPSGCLLPPQQGVGPASTHHCTRSLWWTAWHQQTQHMAAPTPSVDSRSLEQPIGPFAQACAQPTLA